MGALRKSNGHNIAESVLPRKLRASSRIEIGSGPLTISENQEDHYWRIYFEAKDLINNGIEQHFSQPSFDVYEKMESVFVKCFNGEACTAELDYIKVHDDDINLGSLKNQLEFLRPILKGKGPMEYFDDIL